MKNRILKEFVRRLLREADEEEVEEAGSDSIDSQIDKLFISYEKEATRAKTEGVDFRSMTRGFLLEAGEDEEEDKEEDKDEEGGEEEEEPEEEKEKMTPEDIDLQSFASDVVRLIENYDALLEVQSTILRRASNFLLKNYEKEVADEFKEVLSTEHGMTIGKTESELEDKFQAPRAGFAGPAGGGA